MQTSNFNDRDGWIWMDGVFVEWREAKVHVLTHTLHYGLGVFEGVRAYHTEAGPAIFRLKEHTNRLMNSAKIMGMKLNVTAQQLIEAQIQVVLKNNLKSAYIRPMCFYGSEGMGLHAANLKSHVMVAAWKWDSYLGEKAINHGIRVKTSSIRKPSNQTHFNHAKTNGNYVSAIMATEQAVADGYDEALLLDMDGNPAEGPGENLFIVKNGELVTPNLTYALDGITRNTVFQIAKHINLKCVERNIALDEIYTADEAFYTGTAAEVVPIKELDNRIIGDGKPGKHTLSIQNHYNSITEAKHPYFKNWNTICK